MYIKLYQVCATGQYYILHHHPPPCNQDVHPWARGSFVSLILHTFSPATFFALTRCTPTRTPSYVPPPPHPPPHVRLKSRQFLSRQELPPPTDFPSQFRMAEQWRHSGPSLNFMLLQPTSLVSFDYCWVKFTNYETSMFFTLFNLKFGKWLSVSLKLFPQRDTRQSHESLETWYF